MDKWKSIYCAWLLNTQINYHHKENHINIFSYMFPKLFNEYPIEKFIMMFNINLEYNLRNKKCREL
jgi:hypothetical protein